MHPKSLLVLLDVCRKYCCWLLLGIVPLRHWAPGEEPWNLCYTPYHQLPAQLCKGLVLKINMGPGYNGELLGLQQCISNNQETM